MNAAASQDGGSVGAKAGYHHGDLRAQLLNAVRILVEEKGAENFSIAEAARKAGVSTAAPYRHFKDKPAILKALVMDSMAEMGAEMHRVMEPYPVGSIDRINATGKSYIDFARDHPGMFRLVFGLSEAHEGDDELKALGRKVFGIVIEAVANYLGVAPDHSLAEERAYMLWTVVHGHSWLIIDGKTKAQDVDIDETAMLSAVSEGLIASQRRA
ncbi:MAG: TetR/AcrR family transcriptional regulator [Pseudomonadota bacterium]